MKAMTFDEAVHFWRRYAGQAVPARAWDAFADAEAVILTRHPQSLDEMGAILSVLAADCDARSDGLDRVALANLIAFTGVSSPRSLGAEDQAALTRVARMSAGRSSRSSR
ncbi:hypothetical protein Q0812_02460 [Brevundimonas sp. 2R-24]|uniref:Uncharacterized protein n=1 Tax=Peiella sedimenti TaxID=3061083 RepID=A0ABT8SIC9_9CAUL|nr:hypothetical protein [Caulobacteraceae bacterium XZ-24]